MTWHIVSLVQIQYVLNVSEKIKRVESVAVYII